MAVGALDAVENWPVATAAVAVVNSDGVIASAGPDETMPWASVTKLVSALTALVAIRDGVVSLDDPAGPPGATVRHLLAHTSGLAFDDSTVAAQPGRRRIYSNRGFEVLAEEISARAGADFADLMDETVLEPLGMTATRLDGSAAYAARGPLRDLAALGRELLAPTLVPELMPEATSTVFPGLAGILPGYGRQAPNDWGLGFELRDGKKPHWTGENNSPATFGHFGRSGTFLWVDPVAGLACACLTDREFGEWSIEAWPALSDDILREYG